MLGPYRGNFFAFLIIGIALLDYHTVSLRNFGQSLRESQLMGTLELVLLSPTPLFKVLIYSSLWFYLFTSLRFALYLIMGVIMGMDIHLSSLPLALFILFLGVLSFAALGIFSASVVIIFKRGAGINTIIAGTSLFFGGSIFPADLIPAWLHPVSFILPYTHTVEGMRLALLTNASIAEVAPQIMTLVIFAAVLIPLSLMCFWAAVQRTKATGTLAQY